MRKTAILLLGLLICTSIQAQLRLPRLIGSGMVIQRGTEMDIWGWATPDAPVSVDFKDEVYLTRADENGRWKVSLRPMQAGGPFPMKVKSGEEAIMVESVLIGDVWVCSGQSNMELTMQRTSPVYPNEIANAANPNIRQFEVPDRYDFKAPQVDLTGGSWVAATPESVLKFTAVGYFFADSLYKKYGVPIGIINASMGGSPAEAWMSEAALKAFPNHYDELQKFKDDALIRSIEANDQSRSNAWYAESLQKDLGFKSTPTWHSPELDDSAWPTMEIPGYWADEPMGKVNGVMWFRKDIEVPESMAGQKVKLEMGRIVDADSVFVNGVYAGHTTYQYPPRRYEVPAGVLKAGKNTVVVRIINSGGRGGFVPDKPYELSLGGKKVSLTGTWKYNLGAEMEPLAGPTFIRWKPGGLYNSMIAPLHRYPIKGVAWYQGESNADNPQEYASLLPAMISNWRSGWGQGDFPFLIVQLANYMEAKEQPAPSNWAMLRESQLKTLDVPNTALAVIIDLGDWNDIHPLNKKDVGQRLALAAQKLAYGEALVYSGPLFEEMKIKGNKAVLSFRHVGGGLMAKGGALGGFAICGQDGRFVWATAQIKGDEIIVSSSSVKKPVAVRYGWADNPNQANLYNQEGLPASPFRTDDWKE